MKTIAEHTAAFRNNPALVSEVIEAQLARATDPAGEGKRVFLSLNESSIRAATDEATKRYLAGNPRPLEGIAISIKDLFDIEGEVTTAGSNVLRSRPPASADAPAVSRLREAGAILFGRTNMTEFAFSGIGINPHYGTPRSIWDRRANGRGRIPGGSSSGGGVSVADDMCIAALGSDTGGSVRIPSAFNSLVGFKPSAFRVSVEGAIPLSFVHDSMGPLAKSVDDCARIDAVLSGGKSATDAQELRGVRLLKPLGTLWDCDGEVVDACDRAFDRLRARGATIVEQRCEDIERYFSDPREVRGVLSEATDWHLDHVTRDGAGYDPRVWKRMQLMSDVQRNEVSRSLGYLRLWKHAMYRLLQPYDAIVCPTVACIAPEMQPLIDSDELFFATNQRVLRNAAWVNHMDGCAITLPCHPPGSAPVGLQLVGAHAQDARIFSLARSVETCIQQ